MEIELETLTPLWTGGVDGKVDRIHETGILGSLRWWYEVIVRGLGGRACDPSQGKCSFDLDKYRKSKAGNERERLHDAGLCDVCQVFGATGWQRRFRLEIVQEQVSGADISNMIEIPHNTGTKRKSSWYFSHQPLEGEFTIKIESLAPDFPPEIIAGLIQFIADWAALGARAQMGFGVIRTRHGRIDTKPLYDWLIASSANEAYEELPTLKNVFFARITPKDGSFSEQDTFNLKYYLRQLFAGQQNRDLRHFIMGTVKGGRIAAKVKMSRPYNSEKEMRVWGWIPEKADISRRSWNRDQVVSRIYNHLTQNYTLQVWREMKSPRRDTVTPNNGDAEAFLWDLLRTYEENNAA